jgi:putative peptidoglycan lipid II flippase
MVSRFIKFLNRDISSINQAAVLLGAFSLLSQLFGLIRDRLLASFVGPSAPLDAYYAAFRVPDFLYNSFAVLFSVTVLIPFIVEYMEKRKNGEDSTFRHFINSVFTTYFSGMLIVCTIAFICMPWLSHLVAPGFTDAQRHTLVLFSRTMLIQPFLFGLSNLFTSFAQVQKKFLSFALAPVLYNFGILLGVIVLRPMWGMYGVVLGVIIGAVMYMLLQLPALFALDSVPRFANQIDWQLIGRIMKLSLPRTLSSSLSNITFLIMSSLATLLAVGSVSVFQFAYNIQTTPLMIIGVSYATAAFPMLAKHFAEGKHDDFANVLRESVRTMLFFALPIMALTIVLRAHIVRVLLGAGVFSWNDTRLVAACLACFAVSIVAQCLILLFVRAFFAMGETKKPLIINAISFGVTALVAAAALYAFSQSTELRALAGTVLRIKDLPYIAVIALPFAFSIGQIVNALLLWIALRKAGLKKTIALKRGALQYLSVSVLAAVAAYIVLAVSGVGVNNQTFIGVFTQAALASLVGFGVYGCVMYTLRDSEMLQFLEAVKSKFWKQKEVPIVPEQSEL